MEKARLLKRQRLLQQEREKLIQDLASMNVDYRRILMQQEKSQAVENSAKSEIIEQINRALKAEMQIDESSSSIRSDNELMQFKANARARKHFKDESSNAIPMVHQQQQHKYQRKRSSNSLNISLTLPNINLKSSPSTTTKLIKLDCATNSELIEQAKRAMQQQQHARIRHHSIDDNAMSRNKSRRRKRSINVTDDFDEEDEDLYDEYMDSDFDDQSMNDDYSMSGNGGDAEDSSENELVINEEVNTSSSNANVSGGNSAIDSRPNHTNTKRKLDFAHN